MVILHDSTKTILNGILENKNPFLFQKLKKRFFYKKNKFAGWARLFEKKQVFLNPEEAQKIFGEI